MTSENLLQVWATSSMVVYSTSSWAVVRLCRSCARYMYWLLCTVHFWMEHGDEEACGRVSLEKARIKVSRKSFRASVRQLLCHQNCPSSYFPVITLICSLMGIRFWNSFSPSIKDEISGEKSLASGDRWHVPNLCDPFFVPDVKAW